MTPESEGPALELPRRLVADVADYVAHLEPARITSAQAADLYELFAELSRLGAAGLTLLARRAAESDVWRRLGHRSPASWMARAAGTGLRDAIDTLETSRSLDDLPKTEEALRAGVLSTAQLRQVVAAAASCPSAEGELLDLAGSCTMSELKEQARRVRAVVGSAAAESERYQAVRKGRFFRHWSDDEGGLRGEFRLTPDDGARLVASLQNRADRLLEEARRAGRQESRAAHTADALVDLVAGPDAGLSVESGRGGSFVVNLRVDATALRRGHVEGGEVCEIPGVGPVPVATARSLLPESFLKLLVTDGVDVVTVCHLGRNVPAHVRSAIEQRDQRCVVPGCNVSFGLEIDHWETPFADGGPTGLANLARLCGYHHAMKTYGRFQLTGGPGKWEWNPPPERDTG
jgi:hypothetical protein